MGLKCSVLGHAYGETTVERDREERGSEVVITIRELETCERCGDTRIVTENKEVTSIETPDDEPDVTPEDAMAALEKGGDGDDGEAGGDADAGDALVDDAEGGAAVADDAVESPAPDAVEDQGAEILDDEDGSDDAVDDELADPTIENEADVPGDTGPEKEDAVILDDDDSTSEGESEPADAPGERADAATEDVDADTAGEHTIDDEEQGPFDAPEDEADDDDPLGQEWPEETLRDTEDDDWTPSEDLTGTVGDVDPDADVDRDLSANSAVTVPEGEFHCEECGYTTPVEASSLREGDFCPECRSATLIHRPEE